jgi:hypothetical protein
MDSGANVDLKDRWGNTAFSEFNRWNSSVTSNINQTRRLSIRALPIGMLSSCLLFKLSHLIV